MEQRIKISKSFIWIRKLIFFPASPWSPGKIPVSLSLQRQICWGFPQALQKLHPPLHDNYEGMLGDTKWVRNSLILYSSLAHTHRHTQTHTHTRPVLIQFPKRFFCAPAFSLHTDACMEFSYCLSCILPLSYKRCFLGVIWRLNITSTLKTYHGGSGSAGPVPVGCVTSRMVLNVVWL